MWLEIEVLTPVHVGTGELLSPLEYSLSGGEVRVADLGRLFRRDPARAEAIGQRLAAATHSELRGMALADLLNRQELTDEGLWRYRVSAANGVAVALAGARGREHELRLVVKTLDGLPYLPGTAVKGAIRTALIFAWSADNQEWARGFLSQPNPGLANREVQRVLHGRQPDPNHDVLRALMIGDTMGLPASALHLVQERVLSAGIRADRTRAGGTDGYKDFLVFLEALAPGQRLHGRVRLLGHLFDQRSVRALGWSAKQQCLNIPALCEAANRMAREVCDWELGYFGLVQGPDCGDVLKFYGDLKSRLDGPEAGTAYVCIGRGSGWHKLTPGILLAKHLSRSEFSRFRQHYGLAAIDDRRLERDPHLARFDRRDFIFPKSRKVVVEGERAVWPLGWVKLTFSDAEPPGLHAANGGVGRTQPVSSPAPEATPPGERKAPAAPRRSPQADAAERRIRAMRANDVNSLSSVVAEIRGCPESERPPLFQLLRARVEAFVPKQKEREALLRRFPELAS